MPVVPALHRVYATATDANTMVSLDEDTGSVITKAPTGNYPDGLAYDSRRGAVWTTNESGGTEAVIDASIGAVRGTVDLGGDVGNVVYDPVADQMLVAVQGRGDLARIDPASLTVPRRPPLPGCDHGHGLTLDADNPHGSSTGEVGDGSVRVGMRPPGGWWRRWDRVVRGFRNRRWHGG